MSSGRSSRPRTATSTTVRHQLGPTSRPFRRCAAVVYHLYGSLERPRRSLSESDRLDFLRPSSRAVPALPLKLKNLLGDEKQSFLFLGFDLGQWQLRMLVHVLANNVQREYKSFALELERR